MGSRSTIEKIYMPNFDEAEKMHDWRNHVLDEYKACWNNLSFEVKFTIVMFANSMADSERWY